MILQRIRITVKDAGFEPETSAPQVWCATDEPSHRQDVEDELYQHLLICHRPVKNHNGGEGGEAEHPEPEEDVDLLVEDVEREDAEGVMLLQLARGPELVESALG